MRTRWLVCLAAFAGCKKDPAPGAALPGEPASTAAQDARPQPAPDGAGAGSVASPRGGAMHHHGAKTEAELQLLRLGKHARREYLELAEFPKGRTGQTPPTTCCGKPGNRCVTSFHDWVENPVWKALDFDILDQPAQFRYSYESDGKTFLATAIGDPGCDGVEVTYKLAGRVGADGKPLIELTAPPGVN